MYRMNQMGELLCKESKPNMRTDNEELKPLCEREAAARLGVSRSTLLRARKRRQISFFRIGAKVMYSREHLEAFLRSIEHPARRARTVACAATQN